MHFRQEACDVALAQALSLSVQSNETNGSACQEEQELNPVGDAFALMMAQKTTQRRGKNRNKL